MRIAIATIAVLASSVHADDAPLVATRWGDAATHRPLLAAIRANDTTLAEGVAFPLAVHGLWFASEKCRDDFGGRQTLDNAVELSALAECLKELNPVVVDGQGLVYTPGVSIFAAWREGKLVRLWSIEIDPTAATVDSGTLAKHAKRKLAVSLDRASKTRLEKDPENTVIDVGVRLCIDPAGKVDALEVTASKENESYRAAVAAAAGKWAFRPFKHRNKAIRVCATRSYFEFRGSGAIGGVEAGSPDSAPPPPPPVRRP